MNEEQFGRYVPPHFTAMLRVAAALVGKADADDAAQEALLRAWNARTTLRDIAAIRVWLLRITVHVCQDWQRGHFGTQRRRTESLDTMIDVPLDLVTTDLGTSGHVSSLDLREAIQQLSASFRTVVVLRFYAGLNATEIGAIWGLPPATVRTRLRRALAQLYLQLAVSDEPPTSAREEQHA